MTSVILAALNLIKRSIREIQFLCTMVDCKPIRGTNVTANDHKNIGTRQLSAHDTGRLLIPIGPKHQTGEQKNDKVNNK